MGDLVDYGPDPVAVIDWIREIGYRQSQGTMTTLWITSTAAVATNTSTCQRPRGNYTWGQITEKEEQFLRDCLTSDLDFTFDRLKIRAIHGSPQSFFDYIYPDTPPEKVDECAGRHNLRLSSGRPHPRPMIRSPELTVLNPGSVGPAPGQATGGRPAWSSIPTQERGNY